MSEPIGKSETELVIETFIDRIKEKRWLRETQGSITCPLQGVHDSA
ncbi:MAG: hypothetical protein QOI57_2189 [Rubrobacteraceae bacterium]|nr:hypothetical protein [Rubrobacteraceae bacterium]